MRKLNISLKDNSYDIFIENGIISKANEYIKEVYKNKKVYIINNADLRCHLRSAADEKLFLRIGKASQESVQCSRISGLQLRLL